MPDHSWKPVKWISLVAFILGIKGPMMLLGILKSWILPEAGRFEAILIGFITAVACALAIVGLVKGQGRLLNFITLLASAPALLFLIVFGLGHLF